MFTQSFTVPFWVIALFSLIFLVKSGLMLFWFIKQKTLSAELGSYSSTQARTDTAKPYHPTTLSTQEALEAKALEAMDLHDTFRKFIPTQFIEHLTEHDERELRLGKADEEDIAVMFLDIRKFSELSQQLTPQQTLNFLNAFFVRMNAPIHANYGFVDKFIGDAILALFDHPKGTAEIKVCDALNAAIGLRQALDLYNSHRQKSGYASINIGIGVHFGPVIIGTVGSDDRMDTTVLGQTVNTANYLEYLAKHFQSDIIISEAMVQNLPTDHSYLLRKISYVEVKGESQPHVIYEVLNHLPKAIQEDKLALQDDINRCIALVETHEYHKLISLAATLQAIHPREVVFKRFYQTAEQRLNPTSTDVTE